MHGYFYNRSRLARFVHQAFCLCPYFFCALVAFSAPVFASDGVTIDFVGEGTPDQPVVSPDGVQGMAAYGAVGWHYLNSEGEEMVAGMWMGDIIDHSAFAQWALDQKNSDNSFNRDLYWSLANELTGNYKDWGQFYWGTVNKYGLETSCSGGVLQGYTVYTNYRCIITGNSSTLTLAIRDEWYGSGGAGCTYRWDFFKTGMVYEGTTSNPHSHTGPTNIGTNTISCKAGAPSDASFLAAINNSTDLSDLITETFMIDNRTSFDYSDVPWKQNIKELLPDDYCDPDEDINGCTGVYNPDPENTPDPEDTSSDDQYSGDGTGVTVTGEAIGEEFDPVVIGQNGDDAQDVVQYCDFRVEADCVRTSEPEPDEPAPDGDQDINLTSITDSADIQNKEIDVGGFLSFGNGWLPRACPTGLASVSLWGTSLDFDLVPACDFALFLKPILLAMSLLMALNIITSGRN